MKKLFNKNRLQKCITWILFLYFFVNIGLSGVVNIKSYTSSDSSETSQSELVAAKKTKEESSADKMWKNASTWFKNVDKEANTKQAADIVSEFSSIVNVVGTTIIVIATAFLGVKYVVGSVESKADVKESLITLLVACVFFFGWSNLSGILIPGGELVWSSTEDTSYKQLIGRVFKTVTFAINIAAVVAIVFVGVKYIFAGASGRAELKGKSALFIVGIILSFCAVSVLTLLSDVINEFLTN